MRWVLRLVETGADAQSWDADLMEICRPEGLGEIADLGLTLAEAKRPLTSVQRAVVASRADHHGRRHPPILWTLPRPRIAASLPQASSQPDRSSWPYSAIAGRPPCCNVRTHIPTSNGRTPSKFAFLQPATGLSLFFPEPVLTTGSTELCHVASP